jgi:hypothetical protein
VSHDSYCALNSVNDDQIKESKVDGACDRHRGEMKRPTYNVMVGNPRRE